MAKLKESIEDIKIMASNKISEDSLVHIHASIDNLTKDLNFKAEKKHTQA